LHQLQKSSQSSTKTNERKTTAKAEQSISIKKYMKYLILKEKEEKIKGSQQKIIDELTSLTLHSVFFLYRV